MLFKLTKQQADKVRELDLVPSDRKTDFIEWLETALFYNRKLGKNRSESTIKDKRKHLEKLIFSSNNLINLLNHPSSSSVNDIASHKFLEAIPKGITTYRWHNGIAREKVMVIHDTAIQQLKESKDIFGKRHAEQTIIDLVDFWQGYFAVSIRPITSNGRFAKLVAIILIQDPETACRSIKSCLKNHPAIEDKSVKKMEWENNSPK